MNYIKLSTIASLVTQELNAIAVELYPDKKIDFYITADQQDYNRHSSLDDNFNYAPGLIGMSYANMPFYRYSESLKETYSLNILAFKSRYKETEAILKEFVLRQNDNPELEIEGWNIHRVVQKPKMINMMDALDGTARARMQWQLSIDWSLTTTDQVLERNVLVKLGDVEVPYIDFSHSNDKSLLGMLPLAAVINDYAVSDVFNLTIPVVDITKPLIEELMSAKFNMKKTLKIKLGDIEMVYDVAVKRAAYTVVSITEPLSVLIVLQKVTTTHKISVSVSENTYEDVLATGLMINSTSQGQSIPVILEGGVQSQLSPEYTATGVSVSFINDGSGLFRVLTEDVLKKNRDRVYVLSFDINAVQVELKCHLTDGKIAIEESLSVINCNFEVAYGI